MEAAGRRTFPAVDETTTQLRAVATRLADEYFDRVFAHADKEFEVHAEQRRSLRAGTVEQGLRLWLPFREPGDVIWLVARRRSLLGQRWRIVASVADVEASARQALDD